MYRMQVFDDRTTGMHWHVHKTGAVSYTHLDVYKRQLPSLVGDLLRQRFDVVRTCPRVNLAADVGLLLNVNLRVTRNTRREVGRQGCLLYTSRCV